MNATRFQVRELKTQLVFSLAKIHNTGYHVLSPTQAQQLNRANDHQIHRGKQFLQK